MKRLGCAVLPALLFCAFFRIYAQPAQSPPDYSTIGRETVTALSQEKWSAVEARFDARMKAALPRDKLAAVWQQIVAQAGAFKNIKVIQVVEKQGYHIAVVTCAFANADLDAKVVLDEKGNIAGLFFAPSAAAHASSASAWKDAPYVHPSAFHEQAVTVGAGTATPLSGTLSVPNRQGPFPALVLVQGSGPEDQDETIGPNKPFKDLAQGLASDGIVVLRYEKRTHVYPARFSVSAQYTVRQETTDDAERAVALLSTLPEVDKKHIYLLGHSLGGTLAPRIAAQDPQIAGIVLMAASARPLEKVAVEQLKYIAALPGNPYQDAMQQQIVAAEKAERQIESPALRPSDQINFLGAQIPGSYFLDLRNYNPVDTAARLKIPILVLQGGHDYQVTAADYALWRKGLASDPSATFHYYPDLTHLFLPAPNSGPASPADYANAGHVAPEVITGIANWIKANSGSM